MGGLFQEGTGLSINASLPRHHHPLVLLFPADLFMESIGRQLSLLCVHHGSVRALGGESSVVGESVVPSG